MKAIGVQSLPLHKPIILQKGHTLKQAAQAMKNNRVGSVLVSDGQGMLKGIFTDRDLALALALDNVPPTDVLENATRAPLIYVTESATLKDVVNTMIKFSIRRVPVVHMRTNGKQRCLGVITLDDLVKEKLIDLSEESLILKSQLRGFEERIGKGRIRSIFHSQGNKEHSFHTFIKTVESEIGLNRTKSQLLATETLMFILKRTTVKSGQRLLSQLPHELQMQLLSSVSPADRTITGKLMLSHIKRRFHADADEAKFLLERFWKSLERSVSPGEINQLSRELPRDFMELFSESPGH